MVLEKWHGLRKNMRCLSLSLLLIASLCHWQPSCPFSISRVLKILSKVAWLFPPNSTMQTLEPTKRFLLRYREFRVWSKAFLTAQILTTLLTANIPLALLPSPHPHGRGCHPQPLILKPQPLFPLPHTLWGIYLAVGLMGHPPLCS